MPQISKTFGIDVGHRLLKHEGKCRNVHGHRYNVEITVAAKELDGIGRVLDFGEIKRIFGGWLDAVLDHGFVAQRGDPIISLLQEDRSKLLIVEFPPTAEHLAEYLHGKACEILVSVPVTVRRIRVWETPTSMAEYPET